MPNILMLAALALFSLTLFLAGCAEDAEETVTSIEIPISFSTLMAQGHNVAESGVLVEVRVIITGPGMDEIMWQKDAVTFPEPETLYRLPDPLLITDIPVGKDRTIKVQLWAEGTVHWEGQTTTDISSNGTNQVSITIQPVSDD